MTQSTSLHVAIVMDGNGRWAARRGRPRTAGHRAGAAAVRRVVEAAPGLGVGALTLFAFSADNWRRPPSEVAALMRLFARHLRLAVDYSARAAIRAGRILPDVDLLIRTGGERRLSDFLLWECAYAELYFTETMWPDFDAADLAAAVREFQSRERRFGGLPDAAAG